MLRPRDSHDLQAALGDADRLADGRRCAGCTTCSATRSRCSSSPRRPAELRVESWIEIEQFALDAPDYQLAADAERWPFAYDAEDRRDLGPTLERHYPDRRARSRAWALRAPGRGRDWHARAADALTREIKQRLRYAARDDEGTQAPLETLARGGGTCRDYALLMMEAVRSLGFAARFVTGYLYDPALDGGPSGIQGAGATHAWVQVYLPGAGWVEFDPTNGIVGGRT